MAVVHLITLGVLAELTVDTSDLTHTTLSEVTQKKIDINNLKGISKKIDYVNVNRENSFTEKEP